MIANRMKTIPPAIVTAMIVMLAGATGAQAKPVKLVPSSHITNGFEYPESAAVAPNGNVYVADRGNSRVQELTATGDFVLMFGREVNETKVNEFKEAGNPHKITDVEENVCTAASGNTCKAGVEGTGAGAFREVQSVAIDPATPHNIYVQDLLSWRVAEYTADGRFVLMFGREVNETKVNEFKEAGNPHKITEAEENICTAASGDVCTSGVQSAVGSAEHGGFKFAQFAGDLLAVGAEHLLYVGDEQRVQVFEADGKWKRELSLTSISSAPGSRVTALAVDSAGDVYVVLSFVANSIREFNSSGLEIKKFPVSPRQPGLEVTIQGIALDSSEHVAVSAFEAGPHQSALAFGSLLGAEEGNLITEFTIPAPDLGISFGGSNDLYASLGNEVLVYTPVNVAELLTRPVTCESGVEHDTDETFDCSLKGEANPWGVGETEVWFQWGRTEALGSETPKTSVPLGEVLVPVSIKVATVRPGETAFYYRLSGYDKNVEPPERPLFSSPTASFLTPIVAPRIVSDPSILFVKASSAVMFDELNPENAKTEYFFEYGEVDALEECKEGVREAEEQKTICEGVSATSVLESKAYGKIGTTQEVTELQPDTTYHYRLFAESESADKKQKLHEIGAEREFKTGSAPKVRAFTGPYSMVAATTAVVSGTVNSDGQPATYRFELGAYAGSDTQYGVVFSGSVGSSTTLVGESLALTGLQPATTYAYRIFVQSGYGKAWGETATFTTRGLPSVLFAPTVVAQLSIPNIPFPKEPAKVTPKKLTRAQQLALALKACAKQPKSKRAACRRSARKKYAVTKTKSKKK